MNNQAYAPRRSVADLPRLGLPPIGGPPMLRADDRAENGDGCSGPSEPGGYDHGGGGPPPPQPKRRGHTLDEAARRLGLAPMTVRRKWKAGKLAGWKDEADGGRIYIFLDDEPKPAAAVAPRRSDQPHGPGRELATDAPAPPPAAAPTGEERAVYDRLATVLYEQNRWLRERVAAVEDLYRAATADNAHLREQSATLRARLEGAEGAIPVTGTPIRKRMTVERMDAGGELRPAEPTLFGGLRRGVSRLVRSVGLAGRPSGQGRDLPH